MRCCPGASAALLLAALAAVLWLWTPPDSAAVVVAAPGDPARTEARAPGPIRVADDGFPPEFYQRHPRGSRVAMQLPAVTQGIPLGGGRFVPALNGVTVADGIPPIRRDPRLPPPGPVVAKITDLQGQEWWLHEDGSQTSCSFASVTTSDGGTRRIVSTQHGAPPAGGGHGALGAR